MRINYLFIYVREIYYNNWKDKEWGITTSLLFFIPAPPELL
jgi:hypothetical protein|nr:MAG TPA: hypothetical protein [Caudoviricetes sp.]